MDETEKPYWMLPRHWVERYMEMAQFVAQWSRDPSTKVGAVIVDPFTRVVQGTGYNDFPRGVRHELHRYHDRGLKYALTVHAELNAILSANSTQGCVLFVSSLFPCETCAGAIVQSGISCVYYEQNNRREWGALTDQILYEGGVKTINVDTDDY